MKKAPIGIPLVGSLAAFIIVLLALLAGTRPGFMEDTDILMFNTSELGKNLIATKTSSSSPSGTSDCGLSGILGELCGSATSAASSVESDLASALNDIENDVADKLAEALHISEFYSLHVMTVCEGYFEPNATTVGATRNVTNCTAPLIAGYNISAIFDRELGAGPFELNLAYLNFTKQLQSQMDDLHTVVEAFASMFIVATGFTGLSLLAGLVALFMVPRHEKPVLLLNWVFAAFAMFVLLICATTVTTGAYVARNKINSEGADIGLSASVGTTFIILVWVATGLMIILFAYWVRHWTLSRRGQSMSRAGKSARDSEDSSPVEPKAPQPQPRQPRPPVSSRVRESRSTAGGWADRMSWTRMSTMVRNGVGSRFRESRMT